MAPCYRIELHVHISNSGGRKASAMRPYLATEKRLIVRIATIIVLFQLVCDLHVFTFDGCHCQYWRSRSTYFILERTVLIHLNPVSLSDFAGEKHTRI